MIPNVIFHSPKSIEEAIEILSKESDSAILAGGTDIIPGFQQESKRFAGIKSIIDINKISELREIREAGNQIEIGASVTFSQICQNQILKKHLPILVQAASTVGSVQIRNRATIGGNFINNAPCADSVPPLLVYEASIIIRSQSGQRQVPLEQFLLEPYFTQLQKGEIVTKILIPKMGENYSGFSYKLGRRRAVAISRISLAVLFRTNHSAFEDFRIASGAITPIGKRFHSIEEYAAGKSTDETSLKKLSIKLGEEILSATGLRWSSAYKLPVVQRVFYNLISGAIGKNL
jgi:carbon-monoxide dehydrogenase medium subunit/xanthine dehydrogenase FAD-binding subunit